MELSNDNFLATTRSTMVAFVSRYPLFSTLLVLLFWLPLPLGSNRGWSSSLFEAVVFCLFAIWILGYLKGRYKTSVAFVRARPVIYLLSCVCVWPIFQMIPLSASVLELLSPNALIHYQAVSGLSANAAYSVSLDPYASWERFLLNLSLLSLFMLVLLTTRTRQHLYFLLYTMVLAGLCQAIWGSLKLLFVEDVHYATGTFVNRNHLAGFFELTLAAGTGLLLAITSHRHSRSWRQALVYWISLIFSKKLRLRLYLMIIVIGLILTHSRMGNFAFFTSLTFAALIFMLTTKNQQYAHKSWWRAIAPALFLLSSLVVIDFLIVGNWLGVDQVVDNIQKTQVETESRSLLFSDALSLTKEFWLSGIGAGAFSSVFPVYQSRPYFEVYDHVHNDFLEIAMEYGLPVFVLFSAAIVWCFLSAVKALFINESQFHRGVAFACVMGISALLLHGLVDFNFHIPVNAAYISVLLALTQVAGHRKSLSMQGSGNDDNGGGPI